jgi:hypothetical protein
MLDPKEFRNIIHQDFTEVIVISIKIENINPRVHKAFVGLDCIRLI